LNLARKGLIHHAAMIEAKGLTRFYGDRAAVQDLSFSVRRGEVVGLLGPNGAGKSTTMKMLTCFLPPSSGTAEVAGASIDEPEKVRRRIGYLPENAPSYRDLSVRDHLRFLGRLHGLPEGTLADRLREVSAWCGIEAVLDRRIDELSKGYRQRVGLAGCLLHDPELLILDEPTTGLDPNQVAELRALIRRFAEHKTILLSTHILSEVEAVCDRAMIIDGGRLRAIGTVEELARQAAGKAEVRVRVPSEQAEQAGEVLVHELGEDALRRQDGAWIAVGDEDAEALALRISRALRRAGVDLIELAPERLRLEEVFRRLTEEEK